MKRKIAILLIAAMTIALAACDSKFQGRAVIKDGDKTITVLDAESKADNEELKVEKIQEYKNIEALGWQDEDKLLISQENKNIGEIQRDEMKYYVTNLFILDTSTGNSKVLREEPFNQRLAEFSHDKKHILFKKNNSPNEGFYIMDSQGQNEVPITESEEILVQKANWIDDKKVIYLDNNNGVVCEADISGKIVKIADLKDRTDEVWKTGDQIYYISNNDDLTLLKYNLTSKEKKPVDKQVREYFLSTDEDRIAYTKAADTFQLIVCDKNFNNKKIIAEDQYIYGAKWSPDNTKLLYFTSQGLNTDGINVADLNTGNTTRVVLNTGGESHLSWSPSGKKFVVSQFNEDGTEIKSIVYTFAKNTKANLAGNDQIITLNNTNYDVNKTFEESSLKNLGLKELDILKYSVYAKYGYLFKSQEYSDYFSKLGWYTPKFDDVSNFFNEIDKQNINTVKHYEDLQTGTQPTIKYSKDNNDYSVGGRVNIKLKNNKEEILYITKEEIKTSSDAANNPVRIKLKINSSEVEFESLWNDGVRVSVADFDETDNDMDIYITATGTDVSSTTYIYKCDGKKIYKYDELSNLLGKFCYDSKGKIYYDKDIKRKISYFYDYKTKQTGKITDASLIEKLNEKVFIENRDK